jgi:hypothetical protein
VAICFGALVAVNAGARSASGGGERLVKPANVRDGCVRLVRREAFDRFGIDSSAFARHGIIHGANAVAVWTVRSIAE